MDIRFEQFAGKTQPCSGRGARLDWSGLAARLAAAHAARQILGAQAGHGEALSGSFAPAWARDVAAHLVAADAQSEHPAGDVNQIGKADGKPLSLREDAAWDIDPCRFEGRYD